MKARIETKEQLTRELEKILKETVVASGRFERDLCNDPSFAYNIAEAQIRFLRGMIAKLTKLQRAMEKGENK